jgi:protocatechuate 3,4-dioxygenase beta subunit
MGADNPLMEVPMTRLRRRRFLALGLLAPAPWLLAACGGAGDDVDATGSSSTATEVPAVSGAPAGAAPGTAPGAPVTLSQTEGPYFTRNSPERASLLEAGMRGTPLLLSGTVLSKSCQPVARALIDFWQCDDAGNYDNQGYRLRGHQFTDANGRYRLETIVPGLYPGRTRHIHVKVQAPNRPVLTTQLYFPNEPGNQRDGIFNAELVMRIEDAGGGRRNGAFDFVLDI